MKKRFLSLLLVLVCLLASFPLQASAHYVTGTVGDGLTWQFDSEYGHLFLEGTGALPDFASPDEQPWAAYREEIQSVYVDDGLTHVGNYSFSGLSNVRDFSLPPTVTSIGDHAFENSSVPGFMYLYEGLTSIGAYAFADCTSLYDIDIPSTVTSIGTCAFRNCTSASGGVIIPDGVTAVEPYTFSGCRNIEWVELSEGVTTVGEYAFSGCSSLADVELSDNVAHIGTGAFSDCSFLYDITLPHGLTTIEERAFANCLQLTTVYIPMSVTTVKAGAFAGCSALEEVEYQVGQEQWSRIQIQPGNEPLTAVEIEYNKCPHVYGDWLYLDEVSHHRICTRCSHSDPHIHTWDGGTVTTMPTRTTPGELTYSCIDCPAEETEQIPATANNAPQTPAVSTNKNNYNYYFYYARPMRSSLTPDGDGYLRVEAIDNTLVVEHYDENAFFVSRRDIPLELPLFGGVYICEDYNFVVVGQNNFEEDDTVEVYRIIRYTKDWVKTGSIGLYGANTYIPFDAGTLRFARSGDDLYIRTCHEMYDHGDGKHHQANVTICVDIPSMTVTNEYTDVSNRSFGYVSHSFDQYILTDGTDLLALDLGDYYPRAVIMFRYDNSSGVLDFTRHVSSVKVLDIAMGADHYNNVGVSLGGFEYSDTHYLVAGNSAEQIDGTYLGKAQRNIFVTATPKSNFTAEATTTLWLTDYAEGDNVTLSPPQMVKLTDGSFFLMWTAGDGLYHCRITADGRLDGTVHETTGLLSDCMPIQDGNRILWYVTYKSDPVFYSIDLNGSGEAEILHTHSYEETSVTPPTCTEQGFTTYTCTVCDHSKNEFFTDPTGHTWEPWYISAVPTQDTLGEDRRDCAHCDEYQTRPFVSVGDIAALESAHDYEDDTDQAWTYCVPGASSLRITFDERSSLSHLYNRIDYLYIYDKTGTLVEKYSGTQPAGVTVTVPGDTVRLHLIAVGLWGDWGFKVTSVEPIFAEGTHTHSYSTAVTPPTCTEDGFTVFTCTSCGYSYVGDPTEASHSWSEWTETLAPTCESDGEKSRTCSACGETETLTLPGGHIWSDWEIIKEADFEQEGEKRRVCDRCHEEDTEIIPKVPMITFIDVPEDAWYHTAVYWAVAKGVTTGTGADTFSPDMACSRSQVVTFLWRAAGSPEVTGENPFTDVSEDAWYYKAVLWAVENGITSGTTATTFAPDMACSRSQVVTFLYRAAGSPEVSGTNPFSDATEGAWYYKAVLWAVENGITSGTTATTFAPDMTCSRSQVVTFLYRAED